jgi:hypothetical protein
MSKSNPRSGYTMKKFWKPMIIFIILIVLNMPLEVFAREGDCGYEGGISSGESPQESPAKAVFQYSEVSFISGQPIVFKGNLTVQKSLRQGLISTKYTYDLKNMDNNATLKRTLIYNTKLTQKDNKQTVEETSLSGKPTEIIKINEDTYTLDIYDFSRSSLIDSKPAVNYYAGNISGRKVYRKGAPSTGTDSTANAGTVTVDITGKFYGYDQYWGTAEVIELDYIIQSEQKNGSKTEKWGGTSNVRVSSTTAKQVKYDENIPEEISFNGGHVQVQFNSSVLEYDSRLPEFDASGSASDNMVSAKDSLKIETFPVQTRLPVPNLNHLKGHWSENDIRMLYSLEVLKGNDYIFNPSRFMTRAEFADSVVRAAKEVPVDPVLAGKTSSTAFRTGMAKKQVVSPFDDVSTENIYFNSIDSAFKRGLINGKADNMFAPDDYLTVAEALTIFIRATGLEGLAPSSGALTSFRDNDSIPAYARNAASVAERIGLIYGDDRGYLNPNEKLSNARAAALLNRFIVYMRDGIRKDYRDKVLDF